MNSGYCRLCATVFPVNKLINLQIENSKRDDIVTKLSRLHAVVDWTKNDMPKFVCFPCSHSLESAFEFVNYVEKAQEVLNGLPKQILKAETCATSLNDNFSSPLGSKEDTKCECVEIKLEVNIPYTATSNDNLNCSTDSITETEHKYVDLPISDAKKPTKVDKPKKVSKSNKPLPDTKFRLSSSSSESKLTWKDYNWTCASCETLFPSFAELKNHSMNFHNSCNKYRCTDCRTKRIKLVNIVRHIEQHRKYLKLSCYQCFATFFTTRAAKRHKKTHTDARFTCDGCITSFKNAQDLEAHRNIYFQSARTYPAAEKTHICSVCKKGFINKGSLTAHMVIHSEREKALTCDKCGRCFSKRHNLLVHLKLHEDVKPFQCETCKSSFITPKRLREHVENSHSQITCDECGKCLRSKKQLKVHSTVHTGELPFPCTYCEKAFRLKYMLTQHLRQHTGVKPYTCTECEHDFTNRPNYYKHMKKIHGLDMSKTKRTPNQVVPMKPAMTVSEVTAVNKSIEIQNSKQQITNTQKLEHQSEATKTDDSIKIDNVKVKIEVDVDD